VTKLNYVKLSEPTQLLTDLNCLEAAIERGLDIDWFGRTCTCREPTLTDLCD